MRRLGIAYFDASTGELSLSETFEEEDFACLRLVKYQIDPTVIITCSGGADEEFLRVLPVKESSEEANNGGYPEKYHVEMQKSALFALDAARARLSSISIPSISSAAPPREKMSQLGSLINFDNVLMVRAAGALLAYLQKQRIFSSSGGENDELQDIVSFNSIREVPIRGCLMVDADSMRALQIFANDSHPSSHGIGRAKEGLSVCGLLSRTKSPAGKRLLRTWLMRPLLDLEMLKDRLDTVEFFLQPANQDLIGELRDSLRHVKETSRGITKVRKSCAGVTDWNQMYQTALNALRIRDTVTQRAGASQIKIFQKVVKYFTDELGFFVNMVNNLVNWEESRNVGRLSINAGVNAQLDEYKRTYDGLGEFLTLIAKQAMKDLEKVAPHIGELNVVYYPQVGYLIAIPISILGQSNEVTSLQFQFRTSENVYFKNAKMEQLDTGLGDLHGIIVDLETSIARQMSEAMLADCAVALMNASEICAEIDCLVAFAIVSKECNFRRPMLTEDNVINIKQGRHPLQELCVDSFIPNDTDLKQDTSSVHVLTGPNYSGKSVYLKQIAIVAYLAMLGCYVPAESAEIGLIDRIFTRIQSAETVMLAQSTFMIDSNQMAVMMKHATERSLLLIDEFGKGTTATDGIALLAASIQHLLNREDKCPKTVVSTHYYELFEMQLLPDHPRLQFHKMDVLTRLNTTRVNAVDEMVFLYKIVPGRAISGYGTYCAQLAGVPEKVIQRAAEVTTCLIRRQPIEKLSTSEREAKQRKNRSLVSLFDEFDCDKGHVADFIAKMKAVE